MYPENSGVALAWKSKAREETSKLFNLFLETFGGTGSANFRGVRIEDIAIVEDVVQTDIFLYEIDLLDGSMIGDLAKRSVGKHSNTVRLLLYKRHICHFSKINALSNAYRCASCNQLIKTIQHLELFLTTGKEQIKRVFARNVYQQREKPFNKVDSFSIPYSDDQKFFRNMAMFDFESICVQEDNFCDTETTAWISKNVRLYVSFLSNMVQQPIFFANPITALWLSHLLMLPTG